MSSTIQVDKITDIGGNTIVESNGSGVATTRIPTTYLGSGTASSSTFLRGDQTYAAAGGGKINQVVSTTLTTTFSTSASDFTDITGLSLNITPAATSSKILISTYLSYAENDGNFKGWGRFMRDSTAIGIGTGSMGSRIPASFPLNASYNLGTGDHVSVSSGIFLDSPSSSSQVTYKIQGYGTGAYTLFINRTGDDDNDANTGRFASTITAMEILV